MASIICANVLLDSDAYQNYTLFLFIYSPKKSFLLQNESLNSLHAIYALIGDRLHDFILCTTQIEIIPKCNFLIHDSKTKEKSNN